MHVNSNNGRPKIALSESSQRKQSYYNIYHAGLWWDFFSSLFALKKDITCFSGYTADYFHITIQA